MHHTSIARAAFAAGLALVLAGPGLAKTVRVGPGDPPVTVTVPDAWRVSSTSRGIQAKTGDEEVFVWFESFPRAETATVIREHDTYFKGQGVAISGAPQSSTVEEPGLTVRLTNFTATWQGKPTVLRYISVEPNDPARRQLLVSYWASPEGDRLYAADMQRIVDSFKRSVTGN